jgi:Mn-containing catalase
MYHHVKKLMFTVRVDEPDPRFGNMLLEQFGGANGELAAAMQYSIQGLNCEDADRKDLLMDIGDGGAEPLGDRGNSRADALETLEV